MKTLAWLLVAIPIIYFVALAVIIAHHYIAVGALSGNTWVFGSRMWIISTIACALSILVGLGLMKAGK